MNKLETPEFIQALLKPESYPEAERPERIDQEETHISWLFFTGKYVYKVKKPVQLGFLDFTTLAQRNHFCDEEIRLNRRLSPEVYLGKVEIRQQGERFFLERDSGILLDYAVKMRQLPRNCWLSELLQENKVTENDLARIAKRIARFHHTVCADESIAQMARWETVCFNVSENFKQTQEFQEKTITPEQYQHIQNYMETFLNEQKPLFRKREQEGYLRECHGDLHSANICLEKNSIEFIDCIEFNPRFRCSDTVAEIAFTLMDLDYYHHPELAPAFIQAYLEDFPDPDFYKLLPFYKCYRAYTRGKIESFSLQLPTHSHTLASNHHLRALRYFKLAHTYAEQNSIEKAWR